MTKKFWKIAFVFLSVWWLALTIVPAFKIFPNIYLMYAMKTIFFGSIATIVLIWVLYMAKIISIMLMPHSENKYDPNHNPTYNQIFTLKSLTKNMVGFIIVFFVSSIIVSYFYRLIMKMVA